MSKLSLELEGDDVVIVRRRFAAPPEDVFRAHTDPELIRQWLLGPEGWSMPVCINEAKPGGKIRYEWSNGEGGGFALTGEFLELEAPHRIVHVERMHLPDPTPDNRIETTFTRDGDGTLMVMRMQLPNKATREAMLATGMEHGMEASYVRLEERLS
jgi:uncharacterized protein YndB with AHSA1/START domain